MLDDTSRAYLAAITSGDITAVTRLAAVLDAATELDRLNGERDTPTLAAAALTYAARGIAVFPIKPRGKQPLTAHGFKDATTDTTQITAWWTATPDANIGVPTGHHFDVVDIDGREGMVSVYAGPDPVINSLTVLGIATTSRDGGRHIYVPPTDLGNKASVMPGVDYRSIGGYVVAPPSVGVNGRRYEWQTALTVTQAAAA